MDDLDIVSAMLTCNRTANEKGWWYEDDRTPQRTFGDIIALCHSELSEALEEHRNGHGVTEIYYDSKEADKRGVMHKPEGIPVELADVLIRIFDFCQQYDVPLLEALKLKMYYNETRPMRHGGKTI